MAGVFEIWHPPKVIESFLLIVALTTVLDRKLLPLNDIQAKII